MYLSIVNFPGHEIKDCCCCCTSIGGNAPIIGHPLWGRLRENTELYGDFYGDLNDYLTLEAGKMKGVCFSKALHHGETRGLCKRNRSI